MELGGGMTGLCGLGLALSYQWECRGRGDCLNNRLAAAATSVIVTDGNPDCVANQRTCWYMNQQVLQLQSGAAPGLSTEPATAVTGVETGAVGGVVYACRKLRWDRLDACGELRDILSLAESCRGAGSSGGDGDSHDTSAGAGAGAGAAGVDVILGADCLFFREFHPDLLHSIHTLLGSVLSECFMYHHTYMCVGCHTALTAEQKQCKRVYLLQPRRSHTLQLFLDALLAHPVYSQCFRAQLLEDFDDQVRVCV